MPTLLYETSRLLFISQQAHLAWLLKEPPTGRRQTHMTAVARRYKQDDPGRVWTVGAPWYPLNQDKEMAKPLTPNAHLAPTTNDHTQPTHINNYRPHL